jgi:protein involved in polysaccharide export with SLBB domain
MKLHIKFIIFVLAFLLLKGIAISGPDEALTDEPVVPTPSTATFDPLTYTLGPDDAVEITIMRHPEFSGVYPINQEGKLQYKFVGDIDVIGLTKQELEEKIRNAVSVYVNSPQVNVTVTEYRSKYFYVLGEVGAPGKYYMRAESIPVREAVFDIDLRDFETNPSLLMNPFQIIFLNVV